MTWVNAVVQGVLLGGLYALFACGLSLMFGVMRIINLAHGDIAVLGAFVVWMIATSRHVAVPGPAARAAGDAGPRVRAAGDAAGAQPAGRRADPAADHVRAGDRHPERAAADLLAGRPLARAARSATISIGSWRIADQLSVPYLGVLVLALAVAVLGGLQLLLRRTAFGREMRATAQDPDTAGLVGVPAPAVYARATAIAVGTATLAGAFLAIHSSSTPSSGPTQLIFAFEAVVIGGLGSLWGTLVRRDRARRRADAGRADRPAVLDPRRAPGVPGRAGQPARPAAPARRRAPAA